MCAKMYMHRQILGQNVFPTWVSIRHAGEHGSGRVSEGQCWEGWGCLESSSSVTQSIHSGNVNLRISRRRLHVLKLFSGGLYSDTKSMLLNLYQLLLKFLWVNFASLSAVFLISFGKVFTKASENILK